MKLLTAVAILLIATSAHAQQNNFVIQAGTINLGKCTYSFDKDKNGGQKIVSKYQVRANTATPNPNAKGGDVQETNSFKLDVNDVYTGGFVQDFTPQAQISLGFTPDKAHTTMALSKMQAGAEALSTSMELKPGYMVLPNYDPASMQALIYLATAHPTADNHYYIIVPATTRATGMPNFGFGTWAAKDDTTGSLGGKPVALHHYSLTTGKAVTDIYTDPTNLLMEADVPALHVNYIRVGFVMGAPATPAAQ